MFFRVAVLCRITENYIGTARPLSLSNELSEHVTHIVNLSITTETLNEQKSLLGSGPKGDDVV